MAVFSVRYQASHVYSVFNTRARGFNAGPGGWARVPRCSCGWNVKEGAQFGSLFSDKYPTDTDAEMAWLEHLEQVEDPYDVGLLLLRIVEMGAA